MFYHSSVPGAEVNNPEMPQKKNKAVPDCNGLVPYHDEFGSDQLTMADLYRIIKERFDRSDKQFDELAENIRVTNQRLAGLEHEARQPRLAKETDVEPDTKTRKRTENAAAHRAKHGNRSSSARVDHDLMRLTSLADDSTEPPAPEKSIGNTLVDEGAEVPKPCLSPVEMRTPTAAGGLID